MIYDKLTYRQGSILSHVKDKLIDSREIIERVMHREGEISDEAADELRTLYETIDNICNEL